MITRAHPRRWTGLILAMMLTAALLPLSGIAPAATHAQRPDAPTYAERGPYAVGTRDFTIDAESERPLPATVWYPALNPDDAEETTTYQIAAFSVDGRALRDAAPALDEGPFPLVVFSHGSSGVRLQSLFLTEHLASHGFVVIAIDHPGNTLLDMIFAGDAFAEGVLLNYALRPLDVLRTLAFVEDLNAGDGTLAGTVDLERVALSGHSFGGYTSLAVAGARLDFETEAAICEGDVPLPGAPDGIQIGDAQPGDERFHACGRTPDLEARVAEWRGLASVPDGLWPATSYPGVDALLLLAPATILSFGPEGLADVTMPTLIVQGSLDTATPPAEDAFPLYAWLPAEQKGLALLENAGHYIFVEECPDVLLGFGFFDMCSDAVWDMDRAHDLTNHLGTAFLRAVLYDDADAAAALTVEAVDFPAVQYVRSAAGD